MEIYELVGIGYNVGIFVGIVWILKWLLKSVNLLIYERDLGKKKRECLPPGDMGWPFIGNMLSFLRAYKSSDPESFIATLVYRFGSSGVYKSLMFGKPSIIVTAPDVCRRVLTDDSAFKSGWPTSTINIAGRKSFIVISYEEHKRLRKLTASPINGHESLSIYMPYIENNVVSAFERWSKMGRLELLTVIRKETFRIIMYIFIGPEMEHIIMEAEKEYTKLNHGVRAMAINIPGFAYYEALKARKKLVAIMQPIVSERRKKREMSQGISANDMLDALLDTEDENGYKLDDEEIIDTLLMYLNAGHESTGHITMWSIIYLQGHPEFFRIAKEEQEKIVKNMPAGQTCLTLKEFRQMEYLSKVIDETLRLVTFSYLTFREAKKDVDIKGYIIPKGWKVLLLFRGIHHDPEIYPRPKEFNPSRWDDIIPKAGTFLPFGGGTRLCPGNNLAKLEISIFLHHFLLNYEFQRENPQCPVMYLPHPRPKDKCLGNIIKVSK